MNDLFLRKNDENFTCDPIARGRLRLFQPRQGYRFNIDSILLAGFASPPERTACDLGTGCGILGLWLLSAGAEKVTGVEIQHELASLAAMNAELNGMADRFHAVEQDMNDFGPGSGLTQFDQVVCNPPFYKLNSGRIDSNEQKAAAKHEIMMKLENIFSVASRIMSFDGRLDIIHLASREEDILEAAGDHGFHLSRFRYVCSRIGKPPERILMEFIKKKNHFSEDHPDTKKTKKSSGKKSGELKDSEYLRKPEAEPLLVLHMEDGTYCAEVLSLLGD